jgi:hypothetical protein
MIKYATIKLGIVTATKNTSVARTIFLASIKFNIGGHYYSFQEWEHGILRGNVKSPQGIAAPFARNDPRLNFVVTNSDPRILFSLCTNHGPTSCPEFGKYSASNLDDELTITAACFCEKDCNLLIDVKKRELHVSKLFTLYKNEFVKDKNFLPHLILKYVHGMKKKELDTMIEDGKAIKVIDIPLDWRTSYCSEGHVFDPDQLKMEQTKGMGILNISPRKSPEKKPTIMI